MRYATLVGKTLRDTPKAVRSIGQQLLIRGGFIRPSDENGVVWPDWVAPYLVHLISLGGGEENASILYMKLTTMSIPVLWDDRKESTGRKFTDADLLGIPHRVVVSKRTGDKVEWKRRSDESAELLSVEEFLQKLQ